MCDFNQNAALRYVMRNILICQCPQWRLLTMTLLTA